MSQSPKAEKPLSNPKTFQVDLEPIGRRIEVARDTTLLEAAQAAGVELVAICGGTGSCSTCRVRLVNGELSPLSLVEQVELSEPDLHSGIRLACQATPLSDVRIDIPPESLTTPQRLQVEGQAVEVDVEPRLVPVDIQISPPSLSDLRSDTTRLRDALTGHGYASLSIGFPLLFSLSERLRELGWSARLAIRRTVSDTPPVLVAALPSGARLLGLAVDIGTTKLAAYLVDLSDGAILARTGAMNPQIAYGEDVVSRIAYCNDHQDGRLVLQARLVETLNLMIHELCSQTASLPEQVVEAVIVGNTAMHHLFAGLPVHQLGMAPYVPAVSEPLELLAGQVGLNLAPGAYIYLPPNIAGYVGADHVAMLLAMNLDALPSEQHDQQVVVALDIGTNTEITLTYAGRMLSCSCASGPAFEGAHIQDGMRAAPGAIERVQILDGQALSHTIGGQPPVGICGSGILDAVSELLRAGALDTRGVLVSTFPGMQARDGKTEFVLATVETTGHGREVVVNRQDVHEIQLAKGAIRAGVEILLEEAGLAADDIDDFIVAGAFGTYLDLESAIRIGMFPDLPRQRFRQVGNAAGMGARQMLISIPRRLAAAQILERIEYIELTTHLDFTRKFVRALMF